MLESLQRPGLLEALLGGMQDGLVILDLQGRHVFENEAFRKMTGFASADLEGGTAPFRYWPPEELNAIQEAFARTLSGQIISHELVFMRRDGTRFWTIVSPWELRDANGVLVNYAATIKDITERKRLESAVLQSEQRWRSIAENPFEFVVVIDQEYRFEYVNHTAGGITPESLIGNATPFDFIEPQYHEAMRTAFVSTFETGRASSYEVYVAQLDTWYHSVVGAITETQGGKVTSISVLTRNITQQKKAEENLRRSEQQLQEAHKLKSIGTLAGGIAHDLNNILTPILSYADMAQISLPADHPAQDCIGGITSAGLRARDLVQQILLFGRRRETNKVLLNLNDQVREGLKLVRASAPSSVSIQLEVPFEPLYVRADRTQLDQVLTNIAANALQAMSASEGSLVISVAPERDSDPRADSQAAVLLTIKDTGPGMSEESQRRAFEPFYTTKPVGSGTGLGLSIVHGIVIDHGGDVTLTSKLGQGVTVTIRLPLIVGESPAAPALSTSPVGLVRPMRILCVDDEPSVLGVVRRVLQFRSHTVTTVTDPRKALALFRQDPHAFDMVVTDQTMPHLLGTSLVQELKTLRSNLPCVLMTGLGDEDMKMQARAVGVSDVLGKPFLPAELHACVERAQNRAGS